MSKTFKQYVEEYKTLTDGDLLQSVDAGTGYALLEKSNDSDFILKCYDSSAILGYLEAESKYWKKR